MKKTARIQRAIQNYLFDHRVLNTALDWTKGMILAIISSAIFAFGFACFITPGPNADPAFTIITGGVSGVSQNIAIIFKLIFGFLPPDNLIPSVAYFVINIPLLIFAFFKIGKRVGIFSLITVGLTSLFISLFSQADFSKVIADSDILNHDTLTRVLIGAICTGASSAVAFVGDISCGGLDIISYYISNKKSTSIGKYSIAINTLIIATYSLLKLADVPGQWEISVFSMLYSIIYLFICGLVIDFIHLRNKKILLQIITSNEKMSDILLANFPHGATISRATGAYTHADREIIWMVVSSNEVKRFVKVARKVDQHVFISSVPVNQVYGNFFTKPVN